MIDGVAAPARKAESMEAACVCEGGSLRAAIREDLRRYTFIAELEHGIVGRRVALRAWFISQGLWASTAYRLLHYAQYRRKSKVLTALAYALYLVATQLTAIYIDSRAHIGPGLRFPHGGRIVIGPLRVGRHCDIFQGVTLGRGMSVVAGRSTSSSFPTVGNRAWIGPGAVVAGGFTVGDDASVGANSLVVRDIPPRGVVLGVPAKLISTRGSFAQLGYPGMDDDDERKFSLAEAEATDGRDGHPDQDARTQLDK
jgi:serine O-acetyltransferase